jgi:Domain of unknown function (DUF1854)
MVDAPFDPNTGLPATSWEAEIKRLEIVEPARVRIWRDPFRRLCVTVKDYATYLDVRPARVFPVSEAAAFVSFLGLEDKEALMLRDICGLDGESRKVLEEEMTRAYFVPRIVEIIEIEDAHGAARWEVVTDRGYRLFDIRDREDVKVIEGRRVLLQDADGNRYEVVDITELDERSRRLIDGQI